MVYDKSKTKHVEFIISLDNLFSVVVKAPLDEDGEIDWDLAEQRMRKLAVAEIRDTVFRMLEEDMQINITDVEEME